MPPGWNEPPNCIEAKYVNFKDTLAFYFGNERFVPIIKDTTLSGILIGYIAASGHCVDCTINGGTTIKPGFWP